MGIISEIFLPLAIAFIMFSLGLSLKINDFKNVADNPKDFFVGISSQIIILPIIAFLIALFFLKSSPELAVGLMLIAAVPGGATSNMFTSLAKGDVALSVSLTAITSLICVISIPFIAITSYNYFLSTSIDINVTQKSLELFAIVTVPTLFGMIIRFFAENITLKIEKYAKIISIFLLTLVIIGAIIKYQDDVFRYFKQSGLVTLLLNITMMIIAFYIGKYFASGIKQAKCITLECGLQNGTIAIFIADNYFQGEAFLIPAATYSLIMFATSLIFIYILKKKV